MNAHQVHFGRSLRHTVVSTVVTHCMEWGGLLWALHAICTTTKKHCNNQRVLVFVYKVVQAPVLIISSICDPQQPTNMLRQIILVSWELKRNFKKSTWNSFVSTGLPCCPPGHWSDRGYALQRRRHPILQRWCRQGPILLHPGGQPTLGRTCHQDLHPGTPLKQPYSHTVYLKIHPNCSQNSCFNLSTATQVFIPPQKMA